MTTVTPGPAWLPIGWTLRRVPVVEGFSLAETCGPVGWAAGRLPDLDWRDGCLIRVTQRGDEASPQIAWPDSRGTSLVVATPGPADDARLDHILGFRRTMPAWTDPVIAGLAERFPGLRPFAYGSIYLGLVTSIIGQSISVASAAMTQRRLAALLSPPVEVAGRPFWPLPDAGRLADAPVELVRASGVTWRRAGALVAIARLAADGLLPSDVPGWSALPGEDRVSALRELTLVGPWTARSTLLWGVGDDRVWPMGDVALLRAARLAWGDPPLDQAGLALLADAWGPDPGWATRLLWAGLFGTAPATISPS